MIARRPEDINASSRSLFARSDYWICACRMLERNLSDDFVNGRNESAKKM